MSLNDRFLPAFASVIHLHGDVITTTTNDLWGDTDAMLTVPL